MLGTQQALASSRGVDRAGRTQHGGGFEHFVLAQCGIRPGGHCARMVLPLPGGPASSRLNSLAANAQTRGAHQGGACDRMLWIGADSGRSTVLGTEGHVKQAGLMLARKLQRRLCPTQFF